MCVCVCVISSLHSWIWNKIKRKVCFFSLISKFFKIYYVWWLQKYKFCFLFLSHFIIGNLCFVSQSIFFSFFSICLFNFKTFRYACDRKRKYYDLISAKIIEKMWTDILSEVFYTSTIFWRTFTENRKKCTSNLMYFNIFYAQL